MLHLPQEPPQGQIGQVFQCLAATLGPIAPHQHLHVLHVLIYKWQINYRQNTGISSHEKLYSLIAIPACPGSNMEAVQKVKGKNNITYLHKACLPKKSEVLEMTKKKTTATTPDDYILIIQALVYLGIATRNRMYRNCMFILNQC